MNKRQSPRDSSVRGPVQGATIGERIDEAAKRAGITTQQLASAAGVTWPAAKRWRMGESVPKSENLHAIARVCGVTTEELLGILDGQEPPFAAWGAFLETPTGQALSDAQRRSLAGHPFPPGQEPTVATYLLLAEAFKTLKTRS